MPTTGAHGIIIPDPSTANAIVNQVRDLAIQTEAGLADVEATVAAAIDLDSYATKTYVNSALSNAGFVTEAMLEEALESHDGGTSGIQNVSGTVSLPNELGLYEVYAIAPATVNGQPLAAGQAAVFRYHGGLWTVMVVGQDIDWRTPGGPPPAPDTTPPVAGTLTASEIADTTFKLTATGAVDPEGLHSLPYAFSTDNGATYSSWQESNTFVATGKVPDTAHQCRHRVRNAAGLETAGNFVTVTTLAYVSPHLVEDNFDRFTNMTSGKNMSGEYAQTLTSRSWESTFETSRIGAANDAENQPLQGMAQHLLIPSGRHNGFTGLTDYSRVEFDLTTDASTLSNNQTIIRFGWVETRENRIYAAITYLTADGFRFSFIQGGNTLGAVAFRPTFTGGRVALQWDGTTITLSIDDAVVISEQTTAVTAAAREVFAIHGGAAAVENYIDNFTLDYL